MRILFLLSFSLLLFACSNSSNQSEILKSEIAKLESMDTAAIVLKNKYQQFYNQHPKDSINSKYLLEIARYYQSETKRMDSAQFYSKEVFTTFGQSASAAEAMLMYATLQKELADRVHWYKKTQQNYPRTKSGEDALITLAIDLENRKMNEEAVKYYEEYLAIYPNGVHQKDAEFSIKFMGRLDDFIRQAENKN